MFDVKIPLLCFLFAITACAATPSAEDIQMANALCDQGKTLLISGKKDQARDVYASATVRDPTNPRTWNGLGVANDLLGKRAEAAAAFDQALNLSPDDRALASNRAHVAIETEDYDQAMTLLEPYRHDADLPAVTRQNLATAYGVTGHLDEAVQLLSIDLSPAQVKQRLATYQKRAHDHQAYADLGSYPTEAMAEAHSAEARTVVDRDITLVVVPEVKVTGGIPVFTVRATGASPASLCATFNGAGFPCVPHGK